MLFQKEKLKYSNLEVYYIWQKQKKSLCNKRDFNSIISIAKISQLISLDTHKICLCKFSSVGRDNT